jgi:predicted  nucleic acid-binding Zn-ribbon protein
LEIDDSVSQEKLEKIKKMVLRLLRVMGATETQLADVLKDEIDKEREIQSTKEIMAKLERSISAMNPKTKEEWKDYDKKDALLIKYRKKLLHLTHSDEEIKQMEIQSIKEYISKLEKSISIMNPKTQEEWKELDRKAALLKEQREKLQHLTHSYE